ncbi:MAG: hypothetical protein RJB66_289 [Pseudomonadota bacterium]|jgi:hypothetical protein
MKTVFRTFKLQAKSLFLMGGTLIFITSASAQPTASASDKYCAYLQVLQAKLYSQTKGPSPIENLIDFVNSLMNKVKLEAIEKEAIQKKMTFEEFQKWATETQSIKVADHYKPKYIEKYSVEYCGLITHSATFGSAKEPELGATAEKQFDPLGHAYASEVESYNQNPSATPANK